MNHKDPQSIDNITAEARLLVVDDNRINREFMRSLLEHHYKVDVAANGPDALELMGATDYDLILLDIMMPGMSGLQVLEYIRQNHTSADLPVVLVTAMNEVEDITHGLNMGANDYITKPISVEVTLARIRTQLTMKWLLDERKRTIGRLETAERIRSQLFRIASHDLKNPLNNIRMAEHVLRDRHNDDDLTVQILNTIAATVQTMQDVIEDFLEMVELQTGNIELDLEPLSVREVLATVLTQYEIAADNKDIRINAENAQGMILADHSRLNQVIGNLVSNAIKYSPRGKNVRIWTEPRDGFIRICVMDEGPGIPAEERHLLFQQFSRISTRPTANEDSTGLGLWIVRHLADKQGGISGVDFPENGGSCFWVELPVATTDAGTSAEVRNL